jgi:prepilin peptidase CpaA
MSASDPFIFVPLVVLLCVAAITDLRERRIPNWLTVLTVAGGLAQSVIWGVPVSPAQAFLGLLVGFGLMFIPFALGAMGGGDVKLLAGVGAWLGPLGALQVFALAALVAAAVALCQALAGGKLVKLMRNSMVLASSLAAYNHVGRTDLESQGRSLTAIDKPLPYAVPIGIGALIALGWNLA